MNRVLAAMLASVLVLAACSGDQVGAEPIEPEQPDNDQGTDPQPDTDPEAELEPDVEEEPEDLRPRSPLTGEPLDEDVLERPLLIVKIENSPQARPQSGLEAADVVVEEVVEAGVTRFMALFHSKIPADVGPTRSARPVDAQLIPAFGRAGFVYSGARPEVRELLAATPAIQIAEGGPGFHRIDDRRAPHNLYNRLPEALAAVRDRDAEPLDATGWLFAAEPPIGAVACPPAGGASGEDGAAVPCDDPGAGIQIDMSRGYRTGWEYDAAAGVYRRLQGAEPFLVTGPASIGAANVVVLATRHYLGAPNCYGNPCPETDATTDGARAIVLRDGERYEATWRKPDAASDIEILTEDGRPFPLKPGPTWIHLPSAANMPAPIG